MCAPPCACVCFEGYIHGFLAISSELFLSFQLLLRAVRFSDTPSVLLPLMHSPFRRCLFAGPCLTQWNLLYKRAFCYTTAPATTTTTTTIITIITSSSSSPSPVPRLLCSNLPETKSIGNNKAFAPTFSPHTFLLLVQQQQQSAACPAFPSIISAMLMPLSWTLSKLPYPSGPPLPSPLSSNTCLCTASWQQTISMVPP